MPRSGFETAIPVFKRSKTVRALDRAAILVITDVDFDITDELRIDSSDYEEKWE
jgi:hypothetical protein